MTWAFKVEQIIQPNNDTVFSIECPIPNFSTSQALNVEVMLPKGGFTSSYPEVNLLQIVWVPVITISYNWYMPRFIPYTFNDT